MQATVACARYSYVDLHSCYSVEIQEGAKPLQPPSPPFPLPLCYIIRFVLSIDTVSHNKLLEYYGIS